MWPQNLGNRALKIQDVSRWWQLKDFFWCSPRKLGKMNPIWRAYFSHGLVPPPTRCSLHIRNYRWHESNDKKPSMGTITYCPPQKIRHFFESMIFRTSRERWDMDSFPGGFAQVEHQVIQFMTCGGHPVAELLIGWSSLSNWICPHIPQKRIVAYPT